MMIESIEKVILTTSLAAGSPEVIAQSQGSVQIPDGIGKTRSGVFSKPLIFGFGAREDERPGVLCVQPPQPRVTWTHRTGPIVPRLCFYLSPGEEGCKGQHVKSLSTWFHQGSGHPQTCHGDNVTSVLPKGPHGLPGATEPPLKPSKYF